MKPGFFCQLAFILILAGCSDKVQEKTASDSLLNAAAGLDLNKEIVDSTAFVSSNVDSTIDSSNHAIFYSHIPSSDGSNEINSKISVKDKSVNKVNIIIKDYLQQANKKFTERDFTGSIALYDKVLELDPSNAEAFDKRNQAKSELAKLSNPKESQKVENKAEEGSLLETLMQMAEQKFKNSDYRGAIKDYDYIINQKLSNTCEVYYKRGLVKSEFGKYEDAIVDFNKAIEIFPSYSDAFFHRGLTKTHLLRYKDAIIDYSQVIKLHPQDRTGYFNRGIAKGLLKDYKGAILDFTKSIEIDQEYQDAYFHRAETFATMGQLEEAIKDVTSVIDLDNHSKLAYYNRGHYYLEEFIYDKAIADFSKVIQLDPNDAEAYYYKGIAEMDDDLLEQACNSFSKAETLGEKQASIMLQKNCKKKK